eukprot:943257-Pelagomonas_calceolata.AAC.1
MPALLVMNVQMLLQNTRQTKPIIAWLIFRSLAQALAEIRFLTYFKVWIAKEEKREHTGGTSRASAPNPEVAYLPKEKKKNCAGSENTPHIK